MGKNQSKYKSKSRALGDLASEGKFEEEEPLPSTSASVSNIQLDSPVGVPNVAISGNTEGRHYIIVSKVIYTKWGIEIINFEKLFYLQFNIHFDFL